MTLPGATPKHWQRKTPEAQQVSLCSGFMLEVPETKARAHAKHWFHQRASPQPLVPAIWGKSCTSQDRVPAAQEAQRHPAGWQLLCGSHFHCRHEAKRKVQGQSFDVKVFSLPSDNSTDRALYWGF